MSSEVVTTWLRLQDLRPAPDPGGAEVAVAAPSGELSRWFYEHVGAEYSWTDRRGWSDEDWARWAPTVETWVLTVDGERAGYAELREQDGVEIRSFGLLRAFHGRGLGGWLLTVALRRAQELGAPVWLHTCTLDDPAALPNYRARGMVPYRSETSRR